MGINKGLAMLYREGATSPLLALNICFHADAGIQNFVLVSEGEFEDKVLLKQLLGNCKARLHFVDSTLLARQVKRRHKNDVDCDEGFMRCVMRHCSAESESSETESTPITSLLQGSSDDFWMSDGELLEKLCTHPSTHSQSNIFKFRCEPLFATSDDPFRVVYQPLELLAYKELAIAGFKKGPSVRRLYSSQITAPDNTEDDSFHKDLAGVRVYRFIGVYDLAERVQGDSNSEFLQPGALPGGDIVDSLVQARQVAVNPALQIYFDQWRHAHCGQSAV